MTDSPVITVDFTLDMKGLLNLRKMIEKSFKETSPDSTLVLKDDVGSMSSSGYSLIQNYVNLCNKSNRKCCIVVENNDLFSQIQDLDSEIPIYNSFEDAKIGSSVVVNSYDDENYIIKDYICPVCRIVNKNVKFVNEKLTNSIWETDIFPTVVFSKSGKDSDIYRHNILICSACFMGTLDTNDFIISNSNKNPKISNTLRGVLEKNINKRKSIVFENQLSLDALKTGDVLDSMYSTAYELLIECYKVISFDKHINRQFEYGFSNLMAFKFADEKKEIYLTTARTCFESYLEDENGSVEKQVKCLYYNMLISIMVEDMKVVPTIKNHLEVMMRREHPPKLKSIVEFWVKRALNYYEIELQKARKQSLLDF